MNRHSWWDKLRSRGDAAAVKEAEERTFEIPDERTQSSRGVETMGADEKTASLTGEGSMEDVDHLGDD